MAVFGSLGRVKSKALDLLGVKQAEVAAAEQTLNGDINSGSHNRRLSIGSSSSTTDVSIVDGTGMLSGPSSPTYVSSKAMDVLGMDPSSCSMEDLTADMLFEKESPTNDGYHDASHAQEILETVLNLAATGDFDIEYPLEEYTCRYCSKQIGGLEHLRRHLHAEHNKQTHLSCPEGCNNKIWTMEGFEWHMKIMHDKPTARDILEAQQQELQMSAEQQVIEQCTAELLNDSDVFIVGDDMNEDIITGHTPDLSLLLKGVDQTSVENGLAEFGISEPSPFMPSLDILERLKESHGDIQKLRALREELEQTYYDYNHVLKIAPNRAEFQGLIADLIGQNNSILRYLNGLEQAMMQAEESGNGLELPPELQHLAHLSGQLNAEGQATSFDNGTNITSSDAIQKKFKRASMSAFDKLVQSAPSQSPAFQEFVASIGDHSDLLQRGIHCLSLFLSHETAALSLLDVYSFLHVAYAISRTESDNPTKSTPIEFRCGIDTFRSILDDFKQSEDSPSEQELFDEIVDVMWNELEYAVAWIGKQKNWNWDFMTDMSSKAQRLQVARNLLKAGADNDTDSVLNIDPPDPSSDVDDYDVEPSFVREVREWGEKYGQDVVEINIKQFRKMQNGRRPRDITSKWWDIVTSSIFFIVVGFLQAIQNTNEIFDDFPEAPYSCLLQHDPESDKSLIPHYRDYLAQMRINVFAPTLKQFVVDALPDAHLNRLVSVGLNLVKAGVIGTVRDFENYILGLRKLFQSASSQDAMFVANVLSNCWTCSSALEETMSYKIKQSLQAEYGPEYIARRIDEEYDAGNTYQICAAEDQDETMQDAEHETVDEQPSSPAANSSAPSTPVSRVFSTPSPRSSMSDRSTVSPSYTSSPPQAPRRVSKSKRSSPQQPPQPLVCSEEGCNRTFSSQSNLNRHRVSYHGGKGGFLCGVDGCDVRFTRKDNVYKHRDVVHGVRRKPKKQQRA